MSENTKKGCRDIHRGEPLHVKTTLKQRVGIEVCISKVHAVLVGVLSGEVWVLISRGVRAPGGLILGRAARDATTLSIKESKHFTISFAIL